MWRPGWSNRDEWSNNGLSEAKWRCGLNLSHPLVLTFKSSKCPRPWQWQRRWQQQERFCHVFCLCSVADRKFLVVTLRRLWGVAHLLPGIDQIHAGAKHLHQLFLVVRDVSLHDVHAGPQQPLERLHIHNCIVRKRWGREWVLHTSKSKSLPSHKPFLKHGHSCWRKQTTGYWTLAKDRVLCGHSRAMSSKFETLDNVAAPILSVPTQPCTLVSISALSTQAGGFYARLIHRLLSVLRNIC